MFVLLQTGSWGRQTVTLSQELRHTEEERNRPIGRSTKDGVLASRWVFSSMAMREQPQKWLVDMNLQLHDPHQRVSNQTHSQIWALSNLWFDLGLEPCQQTHPKGGWVSHLGNTRTIDSFCFVVFLLVSQPKKGTLKNDTYIVACRAWRFSSRRLSSRAVPEAEVVSLRQELQAEHLGPSVSREGCRVDSP